MVDLSPFVSGIDAARKHIKDMSPCSDPRQSFYEEITSYGYVLDKDISLNEIVRIQSPEDRKGKKSGWYYYTEFEDDNNEGHVIGFASYGSFKSSVEKTTWCSKSTIHMTTQERINYHSQIESARLRKEAEIKALNEESAKKAYTLWINASKPSGSLYLAKKGISACENIRETFDKYECGELIIPITDNDQIVSLQFILNDGEYVTKDGELMGNKKMLYGGRKKGCYLSIGRDTPTIRIAEGYSTAKTIHDITGDKTYCCFDSGNIYEVSSKVKNKYPDNKIVICGDDDQFNKSNSGRLKAMQAADALGIDCVFPVFKDLSSKPTDFNDMYILQGKDDVISVLIKKHDLYEDKSKNNTVEYKSGYTPRIIKEIENYYNATSGNKQPLFAIQTAIAVSSVLCARSFETNLSNRTSLFLMNIGKSTTGKEHAKKTMEKILEACGQSNLISGDGYTSGSAVISALQERPRHITVIDEFSKYLQAAQNKNSSHLMEANSQLMQAISRLDGNMRPRAYATIGLTKDKKKELAEMKVINPAITLLSMSTPDDLFRTIDISSIKDGFLNRFIICISDAQRSLREHKEPIDVPESIIEWCNKLDERRGISIETATEEPKINTLLFTNDAILLQREFQQYCIDKANALESMGLAEISGRSNEMAMRLSLIASLSDDPMAEYIEERHMVWAIDWIKFNLERLIDKLKMSVSASAHEGDKKEVLGAIRGSKNGVTWSSMQKRSPYSKHKTKDLKEILSALIDAELIIEEPFQDGGRGRPTKIYKALA